MFSSQFWVTLISSGRSLRHSYGFFLDHCAWLGSLPLHQLEHWCLLCIRWGWPVKSWLEGIACKLFSIVGSVIWLWGLWRLIDPQSSSLRHWSCWGWLGRICESFWWTNKRPWRSEIKENLVLDMHNLKYLFEEVRTIFKFFFVVLVQLFLRNEIQVGIWNSYIKSCMKRHIEDI